MESRSSDRELVRASVADPAVFALLYERHRRAVAGYVVRRVGGEAVEDVAAEVFVRAFRARHGYVPQHESLLPWLLGIANNVISEHRKLERRRLAALERLVRGGIGARRVDPGARRFRRDRAPRPPRQQPPPDARQGYGAGACVPVLGRPRSRADVVPRALLSRGFVRSEGLQVHRSRLVFNNGHAKMWLLPGTRGVCLVGTHQLQAGCSSPRSVTQRGLIAAPVTPQGFASAVGELPAHTELAAHLRDGAIIRVPTNANGAFAAPFVHPALSFILRTPSGHAITLLAAP